jgi:hypothetical protein
MSYEGHTNYFCSNGHFLDSADAYYNIAVRPCWCGTKRVFEESVDQTNGCCCEDGKTCSAHSRVLQNKIRVDKKPCTCERGKVTVTKSFQTGEQIEIDCPTCKGTTQLDEPVYEISGIDYTKGN